MRSEVPDSPRHCLVVGGGPAGLAAALALAASGVEALLLAPPGAGRMPHRDTRTTALLGCSVRFLRNLGLWQAIAPHAAPIGSLRIIDDTGRLLRAPTIEFHAREIGSEPFGYNIANSDLLAAAWARVRGCAGISVQETQRAIRLGAEADAVRVTLLEGSQIRARLVVGADGRESLCREAAGIRARTWRYPQTAIACNLRHSAPHDDVCTEIHRPCGPLTVVPLPGRESSLVWVEAPDVAQRLMRTSDADFAAELEARLQGLLGRIEGVGPRMAFPLSGLSAHPYARNRIALVGEAAHVLPPIGAQGLNLGFRDAAALADCVAAAFAAGRDVGGGDVLSAYTAARRMDVATRTAMADVLNRTLLADVLPVQAARGLALSFIGRIAPLRQLVMRLGLAPQGPLPRLMMQG